MRTKCFEPLQKQRSSVRFKLNKFDARRCFCSGTSLLLLCLFLMRYATDIVSHYAFDKKKKIGKKIAVYIFRYYIVYSHYPNSCLRLPIEWVVILLWLN